MFMQDRNFDIRAKKNTKNENNILILFVSYWFLVLLVLVVEMIVLF